MGDSSVTSYVTVKLPKAIGNQIDDVVSRKLLGYRSRAEFVTEAVREKIVAVKGDSE